MCHALGSSLTGITDRIRTLDPPLPPRVYLTQTDLSIARPVVVGKQYFWCRVHLKKKKKKDPDFDRVFLAF